MARIFCIGIKLHSYGWSVIGAPTNKGERKMYTIVRTFTSWNIILSIVTLVFAFALGSEVQAQVTQLSITATPTAVKPGDKITITAKTNTTFDSSQYNLSVIVAYQGMLVKGPLTATNVTPTSSTYQWSAAATDAGGAYSLVATLAPVQNSADTSGALIAQTTVSVSSTIANGACGSASGLVTATAPTTNLCSAGVASKTTAYTGYAAQGVWAWTCKGSNGGSTASCAGVNSLPSHTAQFTLDFTDDSALTAFLQKSKPSNLNSVIPINFSAMGPLIKAKGYKAQEFLGGYAAQWAQDYLAGKGIVPGMLGAIKNVIDKEVAAGVSIILVNEIFWAPGETDWFTPTSIAYNVKGINILYDYIHAKYPGVLFGLSMGDGQGVNLHMALLKAGLKEDIAQLEIYNLLVSGNNPFVISGLTSLFPNVKTSVLLYNTVTLCGGWGTNWIDPAQIDYISFWNVNGDGKYIGPMIDVSWQQNAVTFAATGGKPFCELPTSYSKAGTFNVQNTTFSVPIIDFYFILSPPSSIASCEYAVMSGANAVMGPSDPSVRTTVPWTPRTCNGSVSISVGPTGNCRDKGRNTCLVLSRARTSNDEIGNTTYLKYSISY
jgi:hypothetical protein